MRAVCRASDQADATQNITSSDAFIRKAGGVNAVAQEINEIASLILRGQKEVLRITSYSRN